ncbi:AGC family protein kinase [Tritrichomonas foetus]|uniref:non-specific serine/threonine protein kinase n=1 Tax=Tritrichomonas foetus TaxID=1144522 RepID=A0A1J4JY04_9EUKA|nr:AGC family protein kinase [Tritrichomonas foetus]|eukprot:OHT03570.1 AGC family protein kinase [Tritrichomonas foetus]
MLDDTDDSTKPPPISIPVRSPTPFLPTQSNNIIPKIDPSSIPRSYSVDKPISSPVRPRRSRSDFIFGECLGRGAFGEVYEVQFKEDQRWYAMKILSKAHIFKEKKIDYVKVERDAMNRLHHDNIIRLTLTFQDKVNLYYVVELARNGDLAKQLNKYVAFTEDCNKIILGQILLGMGHMHKRRVLHRDIKPENILLDEKNRVKISDFGTAKLFAEESKFRAPRGSFVGSADYVSPEVLKETTIGPMSDMWSFGCMVYTLFTGESPFHSESNYQTFQKIQNIEYSIPDFVPAAARDLIEKILVLDPEHRFGHDSYDDEYEDVKQHPFFNGVDWDNLAKEIPPPWKSFEPAVSRREAILDEQRKAETETSFGENIILESFVKFKKSDGEIIDACAVLTNRPRIFVSDEIKNETFDEIPITPNLKADIQKEEGKIRISDDEKAIEFFADEKNMEDWKQLIETVLLEL